MKRNFNFTESFDESLSSAFRTIRARPIKLQKLTIKPSVGDTDINSNITVKCSFNDILLSFSTNSLQLVILENLLLLYFVLFILLKADKNFDMLRLKCTKSFAIEYRSFKRNIDVSLSGAIQTWVGQSGHDATKVFQISPISHRHLNHRIFNNLPDPLNCCGLHLAHIFPKNDFDNVCAEKSWCSTFGAPFEDYFAALFSIL